jgi:hypothetical protein
MANFRTIPINDLRQLFRYDAATGNLYRLPKPQTSRFNKQYNTCYAGKSAGNIQLDGYLSTSICGKRIKNHRIAWALYYGEWPADQIDHINHIRTDNRIQNLRLADDALNRKNQSPPKDNTSGVVGVSWRKDRSCYAVYINSGGKRTRLGHFATLEEAKAAREAANQNFGFHPNHGTRLGKS